MGAPPLFLYAEEGRFELPIQFDPYTAFRERRLQPLEPLLQLRMLADVFIHDFPQYIGEW